MKLPIALNRVLIAMFDSASVLLMIAKRAGPKSAVKEIGLYSMRNSAAISLRTTKEKLVQK